MAPSLTSLLIKPEDSLRPNDGFVQISRQLMKDLNIKQEQPIKLVLGKKEISTAVQAIQSETKELVMPKRMIEAFGLPVHPYKFLANYLPEKNTLFLGPVIGLLTDFKFAAGTEPDFRSVHAFCEELDYWIREMGGFFYVFSYEQFPSQGYYFENGKWIRANLCLPDVIYNRIHSRKAEHSDSFKTFRNTLEQLGIPIFNDRFLSKWEVYLELNKAFHLSPYLPETKIFSKESLVEMIQKFESVFVKPVHGSQGRNIMKLMKTADNQFALTSSAKQPAETSVIDLSVPGLYQYIKPMLPNRLYLVQQGISFLTYESCPMDFRVLCHKKSDDSWKATSSLARVCAKDEFVSNLARGGAVMRPLAALLSGMGRQKAQETLNWMKELACKTAEQIGNTEQGLVGELGIDIGVDGSGKPWLIEVNSKPSKVFEDHKGKIRPSAKAITAICTTLAFDFMIEKEAG
ncbi:YheC/YheD family protein [Neobacillus muris]|uniref:YheC/YheD family endospore coat-associated protein n=1 Tax=Neobacillus muris TaxID=2941334 RepID=UPI0020412528|nr:YheC/YheD family protein [Neobacillus muris]